MVRKTLALCLILMMSLIMIVPAMAQDDDGNPEDLAIFRLESGEPVVAEMPDLSTPQLYSFAGSAGDVVTISMNADDDSMLDPYLILLGAAGEVYAVDDDSGEGFSAQISDFELPSDGGYLIFATTFNDLIQGGISQDAAQAQAADNDANLLYTITLEGATAPDDNEDLEFRGEPVALNEAVGLETTEEEAVYYVFFFAEAGQVLDVVTFENGGDQLNTLLFVFNRDGTRVAAASGDEDTNFYAEIDNFEVPEDGIYMIFATTRSFYQSLQDTWDSYGQFAIAVDES